VGEEAAYNDDADEEEMEREYIVTLVQVSVTDALKEMKSSEEETEMLTMIAKMRVSKQSIAPTRSSVPKVCVAVWVRAYVRSCASRMFLHVAFPHMSVLVCMHICMYVCIRVCVCIVCVYVAIRLGAHVSVRGFCAARLTWIAAPSVLLLLCVHTSLIAIGSASP
jgi:TAP42-like family